MQITLPVSQKVIEVPTINHREGKRLDEIINRTQMLSFSPSPDMLEEVKNLAQERNDIVLAAIAKVLPDLDDMPHRDVRILQAVTFQYAMGEPVAAIKNLLASGDGAPTVSESTTAPTAEE